MRRNEEKREMMKKGKKREKKELTKAVTGGLIQNEERNDESHKNLKKLFSFFFGCGGAIQIILMRAIQQVSSDLNSICPLFY